MKGVSREVIVMVVFLIVIALFLVLMFTLLKEQSTPLTEGLKKIFQDIAKAI
ncbi:MAG: hypothetical protein N3D75_03090 [Candidatus Aenigmarchaeota archaeon]|nr:hypothetical protein [Candidatus Aenigmarchaeota archaeon]